ncbi:YrvL family regulatory protein [uncultured Tyzzerella sp.]|uniref:YrvL family regulatory protein n=1 Tax=uncultured Tyzzerella sp. TaxID=2321398 RepID=UPI00294345E6|nr:YrvL family regulatory protein [uncultured Tyzzerella sp.]
MLKKILLIILSIVLILSIISGVIIINMFFFSILGAKYTNIFSLYIFVLITKILEIPIKIIFVRSSRKIIKTEKKKYFWIYILIYFVFLYGVIHIVDIFINSVSISNNIIFIISIISVLINITRVFSKRESRLYS